MAFRKPFILTLVVFLLLACGQQSKEQLLQTGVEQMAQGNVRGAIVLFRNALEKDANFCAARYQLASAYLKIGKFDKAEKELSKVDRQNPNFPDLPLKFASLYNRTNRPKLAIQALKDFHADHPQTSESLDLLGRAHAVAGDYARAENYFRQALTLDPNNNSAALHLAGSLWKMQQPERSRQLLQDLAARSPDFEPAWQMLGDLEIRTGHPARALEVYRQYATTLKADAGSLFMLGILELQAGERGAAKKVIGELSKRFSRDYRTALLNGLLLYRQERYDDAALDFSRSLQQRKTPLATCFLGLSQLQQGKLEQAVSSFQQVLNLTPESQQARILLAMTFLRQKRVDDAIDQLRATLEKFPDNAWAYNILGSALIARGEFQAGLEALDAALRIDPELAEAHLKKGLFMVARGQEDEGGAELVRAVAVSPDTLDSRLLLGQYYLRQENFSEAEKVLAAGLRQNPRDALIYNALSAVAFARGNSGQGVDLLRKAIVSNPDFATPYLNLARYYFSSRLNEKAEQVLRRLLEKVPRQRQGTMQLGLLLEMRGDEEAARDLYQTVADDGWPEGFVALAQLRVGHRDRAGAIRILAKAPLRGRADLPGQAMLARLYLEIGQSDSAIQVFHAMEALVPGSGYPQIVRLWLADGQKGRAFDLADRVVRDNPDSPYGYVLKSRIHLFLGDAKAAGRDIAAGLEAVPGNLVLRMKAAEMLGRDGDEPAAFREYEALWKQQPDFIPAGFAVAAYNDQHGRKKSALELYRKILERSPNYTPVLNNLAYLLVNNYDNDREAFDLVLRAYRNEPQNPAVLDTLGYVLLKKGQVKESIAVLEKAYRTDAENKTIGLHLADAYRTAGNYVQARNILRPLAADEKFAEVGEVRKMLAQLEKAQ
ncbi:XrtA/PEP-CTERM system TPR-repeat protein PrsT [Geothermobacter hydrogeniphilus]|uniref:Uncharacterized protein n=1 Tax=Geothermobacter hydrogeniphilus TaxID=1969733 RepID=A0A1X0YDY6_9BACT|nr:XrtA/PEP-CTERM system TPR-repeat protein PrsT [Geothermobacter hydrogeniphilus]ORJ63378.1 hypothetical protein B5V00_00500 [Geothermobacter hydrogeniphilus]